MENTTETKLIAELKKHTSLAIAFSGGIDSVYLTNKAIEVLGQDNVLAILVNSELFTDEEFENAQKTAQMLNINYTTVTMNELEVPEIAHNEPSTWFYSKQKLYATIKETAKNAGFTDVADGMISDDYADYRPGIKAKEEAGVISPLKDAGYFKSDVRELSKKDGIQIWKKVASCSLCSRFPYNTDITPEKISQIISAEKYLRSLGFATVRVRHHGTTASIEVLPDQIVDLLSFSNEILPEFKSLGFLYTTVDLEGYKMGKMNEVLTDAEKESALSL